MALDPDQQPMLAKLVRELPEGDYVYEPKWDGFRCLSFATATRSICAAATASR